MARQERDREDILREATALVERAELRVAGFHDDIVIGFRRDGCGSIFVGPDPVYQFNSAGELRRAYQAGKLIKAERGKLVSLSRQREASQVLMQRHELNETETSAFVEQMNSDLLRLREALHEGNVTIAGQIPPDGEVVERIRRWLDSLGNELAIARRPHAQ